MGTFWYPGFLSLTFEIIKTAWKTRIAIKDYILLFSSWLSRFASNGNRRWLWRWPFIEVWLSLCLPGIRSFRYIPVCIKPGDYWVSLDPMYAFRHCRIAYRLIALHVQFDVRAMTHSTLCSLMRTHTFVITCAHAARQWVIHKIISGEIDSEVVTCNLTENRFKLFRYFLFAQTTTTFYCYS